MANARHTPGSRPDMQTDLAHFRAAWAVSVQSVLWTLVAGTSSIAIGVSKGSTVLVAFGSIGIVDAVGSAALVHHFRHGLRHAELADHLEQFAHRVVIVGLLAVGLGAMTLGGVRLAGGNLTESSPLGTSLATVSLVVLVTLSRRKRRIAGQVASPALRSDGHLSGVGAAQAAVTLAGAITTIIGWRWADPVAAIAVGAVATAVGVQTWRAELRSTRDRSLRPSELIAIGFLVTIATADALLGPRLIITGLLVFAPGIAAVSLRPAPTTAVSASAIALAVALGAPNEIWFTGEHLFWIAAVSIVAIVTAALVQIASRAQARQQRIETWGASLTADPPRRA